MPRIITAYAIISLLGVYFLLIMVAANCSMVIIFMDPALNVSNEFIQRMAAILGALDGLYLSWLVYNLVDLAKRAHANS